MLILHSLEIPLIIIKYVPIKIPIAAKSNITCNESAIRARLLDKTPPTNSKTNNDIAITKTIQSLFSIFEFFITTLYLNFDEMMINNVY